MTDYLVARSVLNHGLSFLREMGFHGPNTQIEKSKLAGNSLVLTYSSAKANRKVEVSYLAAQHGRPAAIAVFIVETESGKRFSLEDWLTVNNRVSAIEFSTLNNPELSESAFMQKFCRDFGDVCQFDLGDILAGDIWQDVPMNWKGYK